jgi:two-component system, sensor histidine kinase YesM
MIKPAANLKIRMRILLVLIIGILVFSSILLYAAITFAEIVIKAQLIDHLESINKEAGKSLVLLLNRVNILSVSFFENQDIQSLIVDDTMPFHEKKIKIKESIDNIQPDWNLIGDIVIVDAKGGIYQYSEGVNSLPEPGESFIYQIKNSKKVGVIGSVVQDFDKNGYILYGKKFRGFFSDRERGYLIFYIKEAAIKDEYTGNIKSYGSSFIISGKDEVLSHPDKNKLGTRLFDGTPFYYNGKFRYFTMDYQQKPTIITIYKFDEELRDIGADLRIISLIPRDKLFESTTKVNLFIFLIGIVMSIIAIIFSFSISRNITKPVMALGEKLKNFGRNQMVELNFAGNSGDEIRELEKTYNSMILRIRDLIERNNKEKEKQRELELIALQAQINPHFLYNTLDAIGWMAKLKNQESIWILVMSLSKFFRISLHKGEHFITVGEEIELVKNYMNITQIRFPNQFDATYDIEEEILDSKMLKITLQPLVENAVKHGISPKESFGHVTIRGYRRKEELVFEVIDDGVGFDAGKELRSIDHDFLGGYGLKNVDERIKLEYGKEFGLSIFSEPGKGTKIVVCLGFR